MPSVGSRGKASCEVVWLGGKTPEAESNLFICLLLKSYTEYTTDRKEQTNNKMEKEKKDKKDKNIKRTPYKAILRSALWI